MDFTLILKIHISCELCNPPIWFRTPHQIYFTHSSPPLPHLIDPTVFPHNTCGTFSYRFQSSGEFNWRGWSMGHECPSPEMWEFLFSPDFLFCWQNVCIFFYFQPIFGLICPNIALFSSFFQCFCCCSVIFLSFSLPNLKKGGQEFILSLLSFRQTPTPSLETFLILSLWTKLPSFIEVVPQNKESNKWAIL